MSQGWSLTQIWLLVVPNVTAAAQPTPPPPPVCSRSQLQGQMSSLEAQLSQSQGTAVDLQLQVASLEAERQQLEQALQGAHAEIQILRSSGG